MSPPVASASATQSAMQAASRRPRFRPCAPIGGMTCTASPTSATRLRPADFAPPCPRAERRRADRCRRRRRAGPAGAPRARARNAVSSSAASSLASSGRSTQTRLDVRPGDGTTVNGPRWPMEFGRDAAVRALVREGAGDGALLVGPSLDRDLRCLPAEGLAAVGADDQLGGQRAAVGEANLGTGIRRRRPRRRSHRPR